MLTINISIQHSSEQTITFHNWSSHRRRSCHILRQCCEVCCRGWHVGSIHGRSLANQRPAISVLVVDWLLSSAGRRQNCGIDSGRGRIWHWTIDYWLFTHWHCITYTCQFPSVAGGFKVGSRQMKNSQNWLVLFQVASHNDRHRLIIVWITKRP